jgi:cytochrome c553
MRPASFFLLAAAIAAGSANAETIVPNVEDGRIKAYTCGGCHGIAGWRNAYPSFRVPRIMGQNYEYLVQALTDYRSGARKHPTMRAQGEALSDQDIADIAAYLAGGAPAIAPAAAPVEARPLEDAARDEAADTSIATPPSQ